MPETDYEHLRTFIEQLLPRFRVQDVEFRENITYTTTRMARVRYRPISPLSLSLSLSVADAIAILTSANITYYRGIPRLHP